MREQWFADDYELTQGFVRDVETREGLYRTPSPRGDDAVVAARQGDLWAAKRWGPGGFVLNVWFGDDTSREAVEEAYDEMLRAVAVVHRQVRWRRHLADGSIRECYGQLVQAIEPKAIGQRGVRFGVEVKVTAGVWNDVDPTTFFGVPGAPFNTALPLAAFERATGPMDEFSFLIEGPVTNPLVRAADNGGWSTTEWFKYTGVIPAGKSITVDSKAWTVVGGGGFVPNPAALSYGGGRFLTVWPQPPGLVPTVRLEGAGGGAGTRLTVTGRAAYLA